MTKPSINLQTRSIFTLRLSISVVTVVAVDTSPKLPVNSSLVTVGSTTVVATGIVLIYSLASIAVLTSLMAVSISTSRPGEDSEITKTNSDLSKEVAAASTAFITSGSNTTCKAASTAAVSAVYSVTKFFVVFVSCTRFSYLSTRASDSTVFVLVLL